MLQEVLPHSTNLRSVEAEVIKRLLKSRFIKKCANKSIKLTELKKFIAQHNFYARYFSRYICALLSNLANQNDFNHLMDKLCGLLGLKDTVRISHAILFKQMAQKLNIDKSAPVHAATQQLIDAMFNYCRHPDPIYGVSALCLGAEAIVPILYLYIVSGFKLYQINAEQLDFFYANIQCDHDQAVVLRKILLTMIEAQPEKAEIVRKVAFEMIQLRTRFLDALLD